MFKQWGITLGILLGICGAMAQDKTTDLFRIDNPNLINLNESKEYTGQPLVYIQGVKAPEKANNDMEELQLKFFGTKDIQKATKNHLELSENLPTEPQNQVQNFVFQTPFHQTIQSGFIPHISNFMTMVQILNQQQLTISENVVLINTKEGEKWSRQIPLSNTASGQIISYSQNGKTYAVQSEPQRDTLTFESPESLDLGPNHLVLKYNLENPFQGNQFHLSILPSTSSWPIEQLKVLILLPNQTTITESKLLFGLNKTDLPSVYTQQIDKENNVNININGVIPPKAPILLKMEMDTSNFPNKDNPHTSTWIIGGTGLLLILYWIAFGLWEKHRVNIGRFPKIKYPHSVTTLAYQMGTQLTSLNWQKLIEFGKLNAWPVTKLLNEQHNLETNPTGAKRKSAMETLCTLMFEPFMGTTLILLGMFITLLLAKESIPKTVVLGILVFSILGLSCLYLGALKPTRNLFWQKKLTQLSDPIILSGLTTIQVRQIYPLFVLAQKDESWRKQLMKTNPKMAQETHLYKGEK